MAATSKQLWNAICRLGATAAPATDLSPEVIAKLIEFKMVKIRGYFPHLTPYGERCYLALESGDDEPTEIDELDAIEDQQQ